MSDNCPDNIELHRPFIDAVTIKCPKCGTVFQISETNYESIVKQIRDKEFEKTTSKKIKRQQSEQGEII